MPTPPHAVLDHARRLAAPEAPTDADLLARLARERDASAFAALVERHGPLVWRVCRRLLRHQQDAEDALQATFLVLAQKARSIRSPASLASYLHGVAFRIARRARTSRDHALSEEVPAAAPDPPTEAAWRELARMVEEEVAALPEALRRPLLLCYWEGRTNEEAARLLGWPVGTVKTRLARGRDRLHHRLRRRGVTLPAGVVALLLAPGVA